MEFQTILTVKEVAFNRLIEAIRVYMDSDECVCHVGRDTPPLLRQMEDEDCPPDCEECTWCLGRKALRGVGLSVEEEGPVVS